MSKAIGIDISHRAPVATICVVEYERVVQCFEVRAKYYAELPDAITEAMRFIAPNGDWTGYLDTTDIEFLRKKGVYLQAVRA